MLSSLKTKKSIFIFFFLLAFLACSFFCFVPQQKIFAEEQETSYFNYIEESAIDSQDFTGYTTTQLCWVFSASKAVESFLYNKGGDNANWINISESWVSLAYMNYVNDNSNTFVTDANKEDYGYEKTDKMDYKYNDWGNAYYYQRAVNAYGVVYQDDCPLTLQVNTSDPQNDNYYTNQFDSYKNKADKKIVKDLRFKSIVNYCKTSYENEDKDKEYNEILARMKHYLKNYGVLSTYVAYSVSGETNNRYVFYPNTALTTSHALTIIGYDDEKIFTIGGVPYRGAFKALNSYLSEKYVWIPYEMYRPNIIQSTEGTIEKNNILSNTYFIYQIKSGDNKMWYANSYVPAGFHPSFLETLSDKLASFFGDNVFIKVLFCLILLVFIIAVIVLIIKAIKQKHETASINKKAFDVSIANYRAKQEDINKQKQELEAEIQKMRYDAYKKKQRWLKRQFKQNVEKNKTDEEAREEKNEETNNT